MTTYTTSANQPPMENWKHLSWHAMSKKQQEACPRISIGYTDKWGKKHAVRNIPDCKGADERAALLMLDLKTKGREGIWVQRWEPVR